MTSERPHQLELKTSLLKVMTDSEEPLGEPENFPSVKLPLEQVKSEISRCETAPGYRVVDVRDHMQEIRIGSRITRLEDMKNAAEKAVWYYNLL